jgi:orotate phosphoribosyltransferase-like protein
MTKRLVTDKMAQEMRALRAKGWSYQRISERFNVSSDTARKYAPGGETIRHGRTTSDDEFTLEMLAIGQQIVNRLRAEGKIDY